jgi:predicted nucleic acid-binding protein
MRAVIVTGDHDLLVLTPFEGIPVITPQAFLHLLAGDVA